MDHEFLDAFVHVHVYVVTTIQMEDYNTDDTCHKCTTNYSFTHVNFVLNVTHMRFSVAGLVNF